MRSISSIGEYSLLDITVIISRSRRSIEIVDIFQILTEEPGGEKHVTGYQGYNGGMVIPTTAVETEEELMAVLSFLDKLGDPEMCDLINWGIEGESYSIEDGKAVQTEEQQTVYATKYNQLRQVTPFYTFQNTLQEWKDKGAAKVAEEFAEQYNAG